MTRGFQKKLIGFSFVTSLLVLLICTKCSPLYPMNDWVDVNCFFTLGRGVRHGLTPYLDLYEQKGPLLYFLYFLAALISEQTFVGVFILEVVLFAVFLTESGRLLSLWTGERSGIFFVLPLLAAGICVSAAFAHGGSAEELALPVLMLALRMTLEQIKKGDPFSNRRLFVLGLLFGAALWIKYTFCGFFLGLFIGVLVWYVQCKRIRKIPFSVLMAAFGAITLSVPILGFFALRGGLNAMLETYFTNNLNAYIQTGRGFSFHFIGDNLSWTIPAMVGILFLAFRFQENKTELLSILCACGFLYVFTYYNGRSYPYYALILAVFAPLGAVPFFYFANRFSGRIHKEHKGLARVCGMAALTVSLCLCYFLSPNVYLINTEKEELPPYRFSSIIHQSENATLLNYGFLDGGFYYAAETLPVNRFFCTFNIPLEEMKEEQERMISNGETDFVITRSHKLDASAPYERIDSASFYFEGRNWTYYLYRRTKSP